MSWWIVALLILLFILLLAVGLIVFVSVHVVVSYSDSFEYSVLIGKFRLPLQEKKNKPKKKSDLRKQKAKKTKQEQKESVSNVQRFINIAKAAVPLLKELREKLIVSELHLHVYFGADDAAQSAIAYGRAWALIGMLTPILEQFLTIRKKDVLPVYAPLEEKTRLDFSADISMKLAVLLLLIFRYLPKLNFR